MFANITSLYATLLTVIKGIRCEFEDRGRIKARTSYNLIRHTDRIAQLAKQGDDYSSGEGHCAIKSACYDKSFHWTVIRLEYYAWNPVQAKSQRVEITMHCYGHMRKALLKTIDSFLRNDASIDRIAESCQSIIWSKFSHAWTVLMNESNMESILRDAAEDIKTYKAAAQKVL